MNNFTSQPSLRVRPEDRVFYVGKGCERLSQSHCGRNPYWKNIVNKYGFVYELAANDLTEDASFSIEQKTIDDIGLDALANLYTGGNGGRSPSEKSRERMRRSNTVTKDDLKARGLTEQGPTWTRNAGKNCYLMSFSARIGNST